MQIHGLEDQMHLFQHHQNIHLMTQPTATLPSISSMSTPGFKTEPINIPVVGTLANFSPLENGPGLIGLLEEAASSLPKMSHSNNDFDGSHQKRQLLPPLASRLKVHGHESSPSFPLMGIPSNLINSVPPNNDNINTSGIALIHQSSNKKQRTTIL
jgi:hypothetical protein